MKRIALAATLTAFAALVAAAEGDDVTFVGGETVAKGGNIVTQPNLSILLAHRTEPGMAEIHDTETDTFYVLDGAATIVTGGTMVGGQITAPGQHRGTGISGGQSRRLAKGDVMVIPAGVPHWFEAVHGSIDYYVVKVVGD